VGIINLGPTVPATNVMLVKRLLLVAANTTAIANITHRTSGSRFKICA